MSMNRKYSLTMLLSAFIVIMGSFQFGYQTGVISGAMLFITKEFHLTIFQQEIVVSSVLIGGFLGAICAGISDFLGRKKTLMITLVVFYVSVNSLTSADSLFLLLFGRLLMGFAIGLTSVTVPLYLAEIAPPERRGTFVSLNQLMITVGILVAFLIAYAYADDAEWRDMFSISYIPATIQLIGLFFIPETPSWLMSHGKTAAAEKALVQLCREDRASELGVAASDGNDGGFKKVFSPEHRKPFLIGVGISLFQQITGINTVIYYAPRMFQHAGFSSAEAATSATVWLGVVNVVMTLFGLWLVDRIGRRSLALTGVGGMALSLILMGLAFLTHQEETDIFSVIGLLAYICFFAIGLGLVTWIIISEIYSVDMRARAMAVATFANWASNYVVSLTFLTLVEGMGLGSTYLLYAFICVLAFIFVWRMVPETRGKTFQQIQKFWK